MRIYDVGGKTIKDHRLVETKNQNVAVALVDYDNVAEEWGVKLHVGRGGVLIGGGVTTNRCWRPPLQLTFKMQTIVFYGL